MLVQKSRKIQIKLDSKNIKKYKKISRLLNMEYNRVLSELLTDKYSLPTRKEWDTLISEINKLKRDIKNLKSNRKTQEEIFQESLRVFAEYQGKSVDNVGENTTQLDLARKETRLKELLDYKNKLHILSNNSNVSNNTIHYLLGSSKFDSTLRSYFQKTLVNAIDRFTAKPKNKDSTEFDKPLAELPKYRKRNRLLTLEFTNQSYRFLKNNRKKIIGIKLGKTFPSIRLENKSLNGFLESGIKINNIALTPISDYSIVDGKFYLIIKYEYSNLIPLPEFSKKVGIDVGLSDLVVMSNGEKFNYPKNAIERIESRRIKLQSYLTNKRRLNKHWKKSNRYKKLKHKVDKLYAKERNLRENFAHQVSRYLVDRYDIITMEDLNIQGMMQNKNLSWKIANASWNRLAVFLKYKAANENKIFRKTYRFYPSTKICHRCKSKSDKFKGPQSLTIRDWTCDNCGAHHDRDINAALNIRDWEPKSGKSPIRTSKLIDNARRNQIRDFTDWITFALYLDILREDKTRQTLNKLLQITNLKSITVEEDKYMKETLERDKNRKNKKYQLALNKLDELRRIKPIDRLENEIRFENLKDICLRLETLNIK